MNAGSQVLSQMSVFLNEVNPCLPPHYSAMDIFAGVFEDELVPTIESKWKGGGERKKKKKKKKNITVAVNGVKLSG